MVKDSADYSWSSFHRNALGKEDRLITPYEIYKALGLDGASCRLNYKAFLAAISLMLRYKKFGVQLIRPGFLVMNGLNLTLSAEWLDKFSQSHVEAIDGLSYLRKNSRPIKADPFDDK